MDTININPRTYAFRNALEARYFLSEQQINRALSFCYYHQNDFPIAMHSHEFFEINIVIEGTGIHYIENNSFQIKRGDFFIIPPDTRHGYSETTPLNIFHIILSNKFMTKYNDELKHIDNYALLFNVEPNLRIKNNIKLLSHISSNEFMFFNNEITKLYDLNNADNLNETVKSIKTLNLICNLSSIAITRIKPAAYSQIDVQTILKILSFIDNNYDSKITLKDLCKLSNMSRSSLLYQFNLLCSCSPYEYLLSVRIENAIKLLTTNEYQITDIAQKCGFYDSSHFTKYFVAKTGFLPKDYRNAHAKK